jgi:hypothetical protein
MSPESQRQYGCCQLGLVPCSRKPGLQLLIDVAEPKHSGAYKPRATVGMRFSTQMFVFGIPS